MQTGWWVSLIINKVVELAPIHLCSDGLSFLCSFIWVSTWTECIYLPGDWDWGRGCSQPMYLQGGGQMCLRETARLWHFYNMPSSLLMLYSSTGCPVRWRVWWGKGLPSVQVQQAAEADLAAGLVPLGCVYLPDWKLKSGCAQFRAKR